MYFIANWKMNPSSLGEAKRLVEQIKSQTKKIKERKEAKIIICPPVAFFSSIARKNSSLAFGFQDISWEERGAYTGDISVLMARDLGAEYCIIGHGERRKYHQETNEICNKKIELCLKNNIIPIYCIGENKKEKSAGKTGAVIKNQLNVGLRGINFVNIKNIIIAYEPLWAISSQKGAQAENPNNVLEVSILIRKILYDSYDRKAARSIPIVYGGSVNYRNASEFIKNDGLNGFLIGANSLSPFNFSSIISRSLNIKNVSEYQRYPQ